MKDETLARTYAQALLEAALDRDVLDDVRWAARYLARLLREDRSIRAFLENPRMKASNKRHAIETAFRDRLPGLFVNFVLLLLDKSRQIYLLEMLGAFEELCDRRAGVVRAEAVSAVPLTRETLDALEGRMGEELDATVEVTNRVDPSVLGGLVVRFDGMVADGSLKAALDDVRHGMWSVKFGSDLVHEN